MEKTSTELRIEQSQNTLIQVLLANTSSAVSISNILAEHSDNKILSGDEIICGLIYRLMVPMTDEEITKSMNTANDLMYGESSEEEEEEEEEEDNNIIEDDSEELKSHRQVRMNSCNCEICSKTRECVKNFNEYIPKDELGDKFKNSILHTCKQYNRYL